MKNHPLYKKLEQIALDRNYTVEQVQALAFNQAAELLETCSFSLTFLINMKHGVIDALQHRDDENDLQQLKQTAKNWLDTNFPDWEAERGRQGNEPYITIWLRGKP
ncbi:MAG: hypothetical protein WBC22_07375 [Sedimentisphaerales bacterium]